MDDTEAAAAVPAAAAASALPFAGSEESKRGVVYIARVPPFMKPAKVRHLLEAVGPTDRIYLVPEDDEKRRRRVKAGGNKKVRFVEGWVEFLRRADAKRAAEMLHNRPVISSGRGFHGSDLWSLKYLKHFGWHHLQEKLQYEQKLRAARLRAGLAAARRDNEAYLKRAEAAERIAGVERRKRKRASAEDAGTKGGAAAAAVEVEIRAKRAKAARNLKQTVPLRRPMGEAPPSKTDE